MLEIEEKGTKFAEEVEIDERKEVEVFRVPAHNDVIGAEYFHDFKMVRNNSFSRLGAGICPSHCVIDIGIPSLSFPLLNVLLVNYFMFSSALLD